MAVEEVVILADHGAALLIGQASDLGVGGRIAISKTDRVNDIVPEFGEEFSQPKRKLGVDDELHAAGIGVDDRVRVTSAAYSSAASTSSRSRSA